MGVFTLLLPLALVGVCVGAEPMPPSRSQDTTYMASRFQDTTYMGKTLGELVALTTDKDKHARQAAAYALGNTPSDAKTAVPALSKLLEDKEQDVRKAAASALGWIGHDAKAAVPAPRGLAQG